MGEVTTGRSPTPERISAQVEFWRTSEDGSLTIFSLFLLVIMLFFAGMAVDLMRYETQRVSVQNTLDSAILAASSLNQNEDATDLVKDHFAKAGFDPSRVTVRPRDELVNDSILVSRSVSATTDFNTDTHFMNLLGVDNLLGAASGTARESLQNVEISLIVDISGSMGRNKRMRNLKVAAQDFIDTIYDNEVPGTTTSISIIPYNATVVVGDELLSRLNASGSVIEVAPAPTITGALEGYSTGHSYSTCVRFEDTDFTSRIIDAQTPLTRVSHFGEGSRSFARPSMPQRWCNEERQEILVHSADREELKAKIRSLRTGGWTGIDNGMKWGVALLDPAIEPVLRDMVDDNILSEKVRGRPAIYDRDKTMKVIVLMTDGANTIQRDLKDPYRYGPTRVWYSEDSTTGYDNSLNRERTRFDGYMVHMPDNEPARRWYVPGSPTTQADDAYLAEGALPADARQQTYQTLYNDFAVEDLAEFFFRHSDSDAYDAHMDAVVQTEGYGSIDDRLAEICDAANANEDIRVYAIGFEAPQAGLDAMRQCASSIGNYFNVSGTDISKAFASIAGQISMLRLTN